jgi:hypothetical protein
MRKEIILVTSIFLISLMLVSLGCSSSSDNNTESPEQVDSPLSKTPKEIPQENRATSIEMMKHVPDTLREFEFIDTTAIRADDDLESLYNNWDYKYGWVIQPLGVDVREVTGFGSAGYSLLIEGSYNPIAVQSKMETRNLERSEVEGVEIWSSEDSWIALMNNMIISANSIDGRELESVLKDQSPSLYDNRDFKDVIDRLPEGIMLWFREGSFSADYQYDGLRVTGMSAAKRDKHSMAYTWICKFSSTNAAEKAMNEIERDMINDEEEMWINIRMAQYKQFLKVTAEQLIG